MYPYAPDETTPDSVIAAERVLPMMRRLRSTAPASAHLIEQMALFWLEDDRRDLHKRAPGPCWPQASRYEQ